jgi:hypothetical protein
MADQMPFQDEELRKFVEQTSLYDERHPAFHVVFLMVREALERHASRIVLTRGESTFTVCFDISGELVPRDEMNNRHWHHTLGVLHSLVGETAFFEPDHPDDGVKPAGTDSRFDRIVITDRVPAMNNTQLNHLRAETSLPITLAVVFGANEVAITIDP